MRPNAAGPMSRSRRDWLVIAASALLTALGVVSWAKTGTSTWGTWFFAACTAVLLFAPQLRRWGEPRNERVEHDERAIHRHMANGKVESIAWDEVDEIVIVTTDDGPWADDLFWLFMSRDGAKGCAVSNGADGFQPLLEKAQALPGFDNDAVIRAMGSATNQRFVVWKRAPRALA